MIRKGYSFDDVLLVPSYNDIPSRKDVSLKSLFGSFELEIPVCSSNMDKITNHTMSSEIWRLGGIGFLHRFMSIEDNVQEYKKVKASGADCVISLGVNEGLDRFAALYEINARNFCVDIAHGHSKVVGKFIKELKNNAKDIFIIAGNVATYAGADYLVSCGSDMIKAGIGAGSVCQTRIKTGCGVPQLTAIMDCARVNKPIIADGGIRRSGDAVLALAAGAQFIMCGGMLAGCNETPGEVITGYGPETEAAISYAGASITAKAHKYKIFRGMASKEAQEDFMGSMAEWKTAEGIQLKVRVQGPVKNVIDDLIGGIRSGLTYCGARNIEELQRKAEFIEITSSGYFEGTPHGKDRL